MNFFKLLLLCCFLYLPFKATSGNAVFETTNLNVGLEKSFQHEEEEHETSINNDGSVRASFKEFPTLHPLVVHFPVVLLLLAVILQLIQLFIMKRNMDWVIFLCLGLGFIGAFIAAKILHPSPHELSEMAKEVFEHHDKNAMWTLWLSAIAAVLKIFSFFIKKYKRYFEIVVFIVVLASAYTVSMAGHYGSQLVYIEGVGPQGDHLNSHSH